MVINTTLQAIEGWLRRARNPEECLERVETDWVSPRELGRVTYGVSDARQRHSSLSCNEGSRAVPGHEMTS